MQKAGVNYERCIKYISFLMMLNWIQIDDGSEQIHITPEGMEHLRKLQGQSGRKALDYKTNNSMPLQRFKERSSGGAMAHQDGTSPIRPSSLSSRRSKKRIVIVDDDESSLIMYESFLEHGGSNSSTTSFNVKSFSQPYQALRYLVHHPDSYDAVVLDIRMPKMGELRLFQGLKAANPDAKVIFLTSLDAGPELLEIFPDIRPNQIIRKPVDRNKLTKAISEVVY